MSNYHLSFLSYVMNLQYGNNSYLKVKVKRC